MSQEQIIDALLKDTVELRADFATLTAAFIHQNGQFQACKTALLALLAANKSEQVAKDLREELARYEAKVVSECLAEGFLEGTQEAQNLILLALEENKRSSRSQAEVA